jgi:hypothetical protein
VAQATSINTAQSGKAQDFIGKPPEKSSAADHSQNPPPTPKRSGGAADPAVLSAAFVAVH